MDEKFSDLQRHRLAFKCNGLHYYDKAGKLLGVLKEDAWSWDDLGVDNKLEILDLVVKNVDYQSKELNKLTEARTFGILLEEYGLLCVHPQGARDYSEWEQIADIRVKHMPAPAKYYICGACTERIEAK